jgi:hypothetical protein
VRAPDGPLRGLRETFEWRDTIYLAGSGRACTATRSRKCYLIVSGRPANRRRRNERTAHRGLRLEALNPAGRRRASPLRLPAAGRPTSLGSPLSHSKRLVERRKQLRTLLLEQLRTATRGIGSWVWRG